MWVSQDPQPPICSQWHQNNGELEVKSATRDFASYLKLFIYCVKKVGFFCCWDDERSPKKAARSFGQ